jgi:hypothetical protein
MEQLMVADPYPGDDDEAQHIDGELRREIARKMRQGIVTDLVPRGLRSSAMMVMMMAMTPSLNASMRPVFGNFGSMLML